MNERKPISEGLIRVLLEGARGESDLDPLNSRNVLLQAGKEFLANQEWERALVLKTLGEIAIESNQTELLSPICTAIFDEIGPLILKVALARGLKGLDQREEIYSIIQEWCVENSANAIAGLLYITAEKLYWYPGGDEYSTALNTSMEVKHYAICALLVESEISFDWIENFINEQGSNLPKFGRHALGENLLEASIQVIGHGHVEFFERILDAVDEICDQDFERSEDLYELKCRLNLSQADHAKRRGDASEALARFAQAGEDATKVHGQPMSEMVALEEAFLKTELRGDFGNLASSLPDLTKINKHLSTVVDLAKLAKSDSPHQELVSIYFEAASATRESNDYRTSFGQFLLGIEAAIVAKDELAISLMCQQCYEMAHNVSQDLLRCFNSLVKIARRRGLANMATVDLSDSDIKGVNFDEDPEGNYKWECIALKWNLVEALSSPGEFSWKQNGIDELVAKANKLASDKIFQSPASLQMSIDPWRSIVDMIGKCAFYEAGFESGSALGHVKMFLSGSREFERISSTFACLSNSCNWILKEYSARNKTGGFDGLKNDTKAKYFRHCSQISKHLDMVGDFFFDSSELDSDSFSQLESEIALAVGMAAYKSTDDMTTKRSVEVSKTSFTTFAFKANDDGLGFVTFGQSHIFVNICEGIGKQWSDIGLLINRYCGDELSTPDFKNALEELWPNESCLPLSFLFCNLTDFTNSGAPVAAVAYPRGNGIYVFDSQYGDGEIFAKPNAQISFWSPFGMGNGHLNIDTDKRTIGSTGKAFTFPELASDEHSIEINSELALQGLRYNPLHYSVYEHWMFQDLERDSLCNVDAKTAECASRENFIETDWSKVDCLHIATHGISFPKRSVLSHLIMGQQGDEACRVHFFDVQAMNLSNISVVFLNCCMSSFGDSSSTNEQLSLAWAFKAAGAKAVIAGRWPIDDRAAWLFASTFYDCWFKQSVSARNSFHFAREALQRDARFRSPFYWAAFTLLD